MCTNISLVSGLTVSIKPKFDNHNSKDQAQVRFNIISMVGPGTNQIQRALESIKVRLKTNSDRSLHTRATMIPKTTPTLKLLKNVCLLSE